LNKQRTHNEPNQTKSMNTRILLVEDDANFGDVLCSYLELHGYDVTLATDGEAGTNAFKPGIFDLCIFDVMMPKKDGFALAQDVRERDQKVPIMFVTARSLKDDIIKGFKIGADDYITKPFDSTEFIYRVQALLKRSRMTNEPAKEPEKEYYIGKYHFNFPLRILRSESEEFKLSPKEAELLRLFCMYRNEVMPRSEALNKIWGEDNYFTARSMDVFVTKLRKYLKDDPKVEIVNIHGNGFQLKVEE
jgi:two-component system, OmpR family, response regulator